jgi:DNA (cytosine-5)-methyltransferase 1
MGRSDQEKLMVYYNDNNPFIISWLHRLIKNGLIPCGTVDDRSIKKIKGEDVEKFKQAHFFAGIAGWQRALHLAGWPVDARVWTGSCPCQPFSVAGKKEGEKDKRDLWPIWKNLIAKCKPSTIFGEQVTSPLGRNWIHRIQVDLEGMGYRFASADLCASGIGAPHIRQRLFWVANSKNSNLRTRFSKVQKGTGPEIANGHSHRGHYGNMEKSSPLQEINLWQTKDFLYCQDGKKRRVKSGIKPLVDGISQRMELLSGYGNSIVPDLAAVFISSFIDAVVEDGT